MRKSYTGLILWAVLYCAVLAGLCFLPLDGWMLTRVICIITCLAVTLLMVLIERGGHTYWFTGVTYEDCVKAGAERCRIYAHRHVKRFVKATVVFVVISVAFHLLGWPGWADMIVMTVGSVIVAFSTMWFQL